jgi:molecular chaperone HtpG
MMEQQKLGGGGGGFYGAFPEMYTMVVNGNHPKISNLLSKSELERADVAKQLTDLALLAQGMLKGEALNSFIERNIEHIS